MGKNSRRHSKLNFPKAVSAFVKHPYMLLMALLVPIFVAIYQLGGANTAAQMEREFNKELREMDYQHREELTAKEKECDEWKEKYFILVNASNRPANNSP